MEDAHAAILDLQAEDAEKGFVAASPEDRLSFFGVYDGHGGDKVALFAGENIHKILAKQEAFKRKDFEQALKDGFLATDRAILSGEFLGGFVGTANLISTYADPKYEEEVSGCTASVGLISKTTIYVVSHILPFSQKKFLLTSPRAMLVTHVRSSGLKAEQNLYRMITSLKMRVRVYLLLLLSL